MPLGTLTAAAMVADRDRVKQEQRKARERFMRARRAEKAYGRQLTAVARQVGVIINGMAPNGQVRNLPELTTALDRYADLLHPWAIPVAQSMVAEVARRDERAWAELSRQIGRSLRFEVLYAPTGQAMKKIMRENVDLITSLPREAAQRVHRLTIEAMSDGTRAADIAREIMRSGQVTVARAKLIARTETTRTVTAMVEARSVHVGSDGYVWRTAEDSDVRPLHRRLNGKFIRWNSPPVAGENGERAHAGAIYNCRCYPEPVIPDQV